jgi:hypothetical protein
MTTWILLTLIPLAFWLGLKLGAANRLLSERLAPRATREMPTREELWGHP